MPETYDLVVIGAGTAARVAAMRVRKAGKSVAVIDCRPYGGTCALRGCDPKKMLRHGAAVIDNARRMRRNGVVGEDRIDWRELMAFKRTFTDPVPGKQEQSYHDAGVETFMARSASPARTPLSWRKDPHRATRPHRQRCRAGPARIVRRRACHRQ